MVKEKHYTIGEVVEMLSQEYEEVSVSSLRFLEKEGLVTPERTAGGHRRYTQADIERVRFVKEMQKRFFPLSVIMEMLIKANRKAKGERVFYRPLDYDPTFVPLDLDELAEAARLDKETAVQLRDAGLIQPSPEGKYDADDLNIARLMRKLGEYDLVADDLIFYVEHAREVVEREIQLLISKVLARTGLEGMDVVALKIEELVDELWRYVHAKVLRQEARKLTDQLQEEFEGSL